MEGWSRIEIKGKSAEIDYPRGGPDSYGLLSFREVCAEEVETAERTPPRHVAQRRQHGHFHAVESALQMQQSQPRSIPGPSEAKMRLKTTAKGWFSEGRVDVPYWRL